MSRNTAHRIVFANEKGGTGKSTTAVHVAVALSYLGAHVTMLDLDPRPADLGGAAGPNVYVEGLVWDGGAEDFLRLDDLFDPGEARRGNMAAVATMRPQVQVWDLDVIDSLEPAFVLGSEDEQTKKSKNQKVAMSQ